MKSAGCFIGLLMEEDVSPLIKLDLNVSGARGIVSFCSTLGRVLSSGEWGGRKKVLPVPDCYSWGESLLHSGYSKGTRMLPVQKSLLCRHRPVLPSHSSQAVLHPVVHGEEQNDTPPGFLPWETKLYSPPSADVLLFCRNLMLQGSSASAAAPWCRLPGWCPWCSVLTL